VSEQHDVDGASAMGEGWECHHGDAGAAEELVLDEADGGVEGDGRLQGGDGEVDKDHGGFGGHC